MGNLVTDGSNGQIGARGSHKGPTPSKCRAREHCEKGLLLRGSWRGTETETHQRLDCHGCVSQAGTATCLESSSALQQTTHPSLRHTREIAAHFVKTDDVICGVVDESSHDGTTTTGPLRFQKPASGWRSPLSESRRAQIHQCPARG